jgi:hypothetical protein
MTIAIQAVRVSDMTTGNIVSVRYNGKTYCGEVIVIKRVCDCELFMINKLMGLWLDKSNIINDEVITI